MKKAIQTHCAPQAIGPYSPAVKIGNLVFLSGQIPLDPKTNELVGGDLRKQTIQVFENLKAVAEAAGGSFEDIVRVGIYLTDLANFSVVNEVMAQYFKEPYPARSTIGVAALPKGVPVEVDAVMVLG
jgi:reactive intermediate/imine deaminase